MLASLVLALTACTSDSGDDEERTASGGQGCTLSAKGVPSCGVLWGVSTRPPTLTQLQDVEEAAGRPFDFVYRYHDVDDEVPDEQEVQVVADGRILHIAVAARDFGASGRAGISWADVARGKFDATLSAQARGVASLKVPVFVTFEQEANQQTKLGVRGNPAEFRAAWRHLHGIYRAAGATNAVWTWVMTGNEANVDRAASLWPGNRYVDWISWNVYNQSGCHSGLVEQEKFKSFDDELRPFYDFLMERGASVGIDKNKPMMISEAGSVRYPDAPELAADWYAAIPLSLRDYPEIKAVTLWDSVAETCDYDFDADPKVSEGVRRAGKDPYMDIGGALTPKS